MWIAWLGNNVRVHHRFMDIEENQVTVSISLLGGELLETAENRGVTQMVAYAMVVMLPATVFIGATFPLAVRILAPDERQAGEATASRSA